jgi:hypothetical protein
MPALRDLTGQRFGRLTVLHRAENGDGEAHWLCGCECGEKRVVRGGKPSRRYHPVLWVFGKGEE